MATCRRFGVRTWPQLKLFKYGRYEGEYYGAEDACKFLITFTVLLMFPNLQGSNLWLLIMYP